jgi:hypothetical protein
MRRLVAVAAALTLCACARSSTMPLSADTFQLITSAAPVCGQAGAQGVAVRRAAIETINRGFDKFVILDAAAANNVRVAGYTPVQAHTTGAVYGNTMVATTTYSGGYPIVAGSHDQGLVVKMFRNADPSGANALSARGMLGPKWEEAVKESAATTC